MIYGSPEKPSAGRPVEARGAAGLQDSVAEQQKDRHWELTVGKQTLWGWWEMLRPEYAPQDCAHPRACWASSFHHRAGGYREENGIKESEAKTRVKDGRGRGGDRWDADETWWDREGSTHRSTSRIKTEKAENKKKSPERVALTGDVERGEDEGKQREMKGSKDLGLFVWPCSDTPVQQLSSVILFSARVAKQSSIFRQHVSDTTASQCALSRYKWKASKRKRWVKKVKDIRLPGEMYATCKKFMLQWFYIMTFK